MALTNQEVRSLLNSPFNIRPASASSAEQIQKQQAVLAKQRK